MVSSLLEKNESDRYELLDKARQLIGVDGLCCVGILDNCDMGFVSSGTGIVADGLPAVLNLHHC